jgi:hypothetical protein
VLSDDDDDDDDNDDNNNNSNVPHHNTTPKIAIGTLFVVKTAEFYISLSPLQYMSVTVCPAKAKVCVTRNETIRSTVELHSAVLLSLVKELSAFRGQITTALSGVYKR